MTQVHFTMTAEDIQSLIQQSVENDVSKKILTITLISIILSLASITVNNKDLQFLQSCSFS